MVTAADARTERFTVNGVGVVLSKILIEALPVGVIELGQTVTVTGRRLTRDGALFAEGILLHDPGLSTGQAVVFGEAGFVDQDYGFDIIGYRVISPPEVEMAQGIEYFAFLKVVGRFDGNALYPDEIVVLGSGPPYFLAGMIEAIDLAAGTITVLGIELGVHEWTQQRSREWGPSLSDLAVGDHVGVSLHENRFVVDFSDVDWLDGQALVVATYFKNLAPPFQFTLYGFADTLVQVDPSTRFYHDWGSSNDLGPDSWVGACNPVEITAERFWVLAERPKPSGITYAIARGRFEGGILLAELVTLCGGAP